MHLSLYEVNSRPETETNEYRRNIETNLQSQSEAFDSTMIFISIIVNIIRVKNSWFPCTAIKGSSVTNNESKELESKLLSTVNTPTIH